MSKLKKILDCPFCNGTAPLQETTVRDITFRGVAYSVIYYSYMCKDCKEEFTTAESDMATLEQIDEYKKNVMDNPET